MRHAAGQLSNRAILLGLHRFALDLFELRYIDRGNNGIAADFLATLKHDRAVVVGMLKRIRRMLIVR